MVRESNPHSRVAINGFKPHKHANATIRVLSWCAVQDSNLHTLFGRQVCCR